MANNNTATLDKLASTDYVDFDKCQDSFGRISWSKTCFDCSDVKLKVFEKDENKNFRLAQNLTMVETDFNQFLRLKNLLVVAIRDFSKKENLLRRETISKRLAGAAQTYTQSCRKC